MSAKVPPRPCPPSQPPPPPALATLGVVAARLGVPPYRVDYILKTRPAIRPRAWAAGARCFDEAAIALIQEELLAIDASRADRGDQ